MKPFHYGTMATLTNIAVAKPTTGTRQRLVEAAHALIWANSYAHVSVDDICRAAGVQKGSFYHFFPTKGELAAAALEDHWVSVQPKIEEIFSEHKTAIGQLHALCAEILKKQVDSLKENGKVCGCPYATVASEMSGNNEQLWNLSHEINERFLGFYEQLLKNAAKEKLIPARGLKERAKEMQVYVIGAMLQARMTNTLDAVGKSLETALFRICGFEDAAPKGRVKKKTKR